MTTLAEATQKAKDSISQDAYDISHPESAHNLIGETLRSNDPKNTNTLEIVSWVRQYYVVRINGSDNYGITPVALALQNIVLGRLTY